MVGNSTFAHILSELNPEQREAASTTMGNVFISAGAGTGKTKTLTAHYVACLLAPPEDRATATGVENILAITYTKAAAAELAERVKLTLRDIGRDDLARQMGDAWISTIHSFCQRVLRSESLELSGDEATDPTFSTLEPLEAYSLLTQSIDEVFNRWARDRRSDLLGVLATQTRSNVVKSISEIVKRRAVWGYGPEQVVALATPPDQPEGASTAENQQPWVERALAVTSAIVEMAEEAYDGYQERKVARASLDYSDLILRVAQLFERNQRVADKYRAHFSRIIIDEFQDTNELQYSMFRAIAADNLSIVGDKNQSIYAFQGAQAKVFDRAREDVRRSGAGWLLELGSNYRSHADVLNFANVAFSSESMFGDGGLVQLRHARDEERPGVDKLAGAKVPARVVLAPIIGADRKSKAEPGILRVSLADREAIWIADWVERLHRHQDPPVPLSDIKVVLRARTHASAFVAELRSRGIPALVVGGKGLLNDPMVRATLALIRVIDNPADEAALVQLLISPMGRVPDQDLADLRFAATERRAKRRDLATSKPAPEDSAEDEVDCGLWSVIGAAVAEGSAHGELAELYRAVSLARDSLGVLSLDSVLKAVITQRGVDLMLLSATGDDGTPDLEERQSYENLMEFIEMAGRWDRSGGSARGFAAEIDGYIHQKEMMELPLWSDGSEGGEVVSVMTIHATKGLEYPVVIFPTEMLSAGPKFEGACRIAQVESTDPDTGETRGELRVTMKVELNDEERRTARRIAADGLPGLAGVDSKKSPKKYEPREYSELGEAEEAAELDEIRRLMYVAVTRARDMVIVGHPVAAKEPAESTVPKKGSAIWHAMVKDRFIEGDYPNYSIKPNDYPFSLQLDKSLLGDAAWRASLADGIEGYLPTESATARRLLEAADTETADDAEPEGTTPALEGDLDFSGDAPAGARHLELVPRQAVQLGALNQVSASHLSVYQACPRQYYLQYLAGAGTLRNKNPNDDANRGNALHAIMERAWESDTLDVGVALQLLGSYRIDAAFHRELIQQAQALLASESLAELRDDRYEVRSERQFYEHIAAQDGEAVCLQGYIDTFASNGEGDVRVLDYKSGKGSSRSRYQVQAQCYALVGLRSGGARVEVRFLMPTADRAEIGSAEDIQMDGDLPYYRFTYTASDRPVIEASILESVRGMVQSGSLTDEQIESVVAFGTCMYCGFRGPLCEVGARRKRP